MVYIMAYVNICGKMIYYEEYGVGNNPTLLYLHGGPGESCLTYTYQAQMLGAHFHIISFDQYGVFRSEAIPKEQKTDVNYHVNMIEQMRVALNIKTWIPLGHSFGGMLALLYAHNYPDRIDAVIYDCPLWSALHTARAIAEVTLPYFEQNNVTEQIELVSKIFEKDISPQDAFDRAMSIEWDEKLEDYCHVIELSRYRDYKNKYIPVPKVSNDCWEKHIIFRKKIYESEDFYFNYLPFLADIYKPQLLIVGEYDITCGKFEQEWFDKYAPNGTTNVLANSAHLSWFEHPQKYTNLVKKFVLSCN